MKIHSTGAAIGPMPHYLFQPDLSKSGNSVQNWLAKLRDEGKIYLVQNFTTSG
jgi:hypothetical protein